MTKRFKETVKSLSTGGADDGLKYRFRMICEDAVQEFFKQTNGLGGGQFIYAFDGRKNLIANGNLNIPVSYCPIKSLENLKSELNNKTNFSVRYKHVV